MRKSSFIPFGIQADSFPPHLLPVGPLLQLQPSHGQGPYKTRQWVASLIINHVLPPCNESLQVPRNYSEHGPSEDSHARVIETELLTRLYLLLWRGLLGNVAKQQSGRSQGHQGSKRPRYYRVSPPTAPAGFHSLPGSGSNPVLGDKVETTKKGGRCGLATPKPSAHVEGARVALALPSVSPSSH